MLKMKIWYCALSHHLPLCLRSINSLTPYIKKSKQFITLKCTILGKSTWKNNPKKILKSLTNPILEVHGEDITWNIFQIFM